MLSGLPGCRKQEVRFLAQHVRITLTTAGTESKVWPAPKVPLFSNGLNYYMHDGGHGMVATDYDIYVQFLKAQFHPEQ